MRTVAPGSTPPFGSTTVPCRLVVAVCAEVARLRMRTAERSKTILLSRIGERLLGRCCAIRGLAADYLGCNVAIQEPSFIVNMTKGKKALTPAGVLIFVGDAPGAYANP